MAPALSQLIVISLLVPLLLAQPDPNTDGTQASPSLPGTSLTGAEKQSELYANATLAKLVVYTESLRPDANNTSSISRHAQTLEANADAKILAIRSSLEDALIAKKQTLVGVSVKEVDMSLNGTEFNALRVERADLLAKLDVDSSQLASLTPAYRSHVIRTDLCALQKAASAKVEELVNSARSAAAQLAIIVAVASKTGSSDQAVAARSAELQQCLESEAAAAKKFVQSLPDLVVAQIDGMTGGCVDEEAAKKAQENKEQVGKEAHEKKHKKGEKADLHKKKDKHGKKDKKQKKGKGGQKDKGGKRGKHQAAVYFLVGATEPEELEDEGGFQDELGIAKNIDNLKALYEQAAATAKQSLSLIGNNLQRIAMKEFGARAVEEIGNKIMSSVTRETEQCRQATMTDLEAKLKTLALLANDSGSEKYAALLASTTADIATIKQLSMQLADAQGTLSAVSQSEEAELGLFSDFVGSVSTSVEAMADYADAIFQIQDKMGQNATGPSSTLSKRMNEAAEDAQCVANLVMKDFYDDVKQYVQKHAAKSHASSSAVVEKAHLFLAALPEAHATWTLQIVGVAAMGALVGGLAVLKAQQRQRSSAVNQVPLLG